MSMDDLDGTASELCFALVRYLQGRPSLDHKTKLALLGAKAEIDSALADMSTTSQSPPERDNVSRKAKGGKIVDCSRVTDATAAGEEPKGRTGEKRRIIIAVRPYMELVNGDSNQTMMEWLFGRHFYEWYWARKSAMGVITVILALFNWVFVGTEVMMDGAIGLMAGCVGIVACVASLVTIFGIASRRLLALSVRSFEALHFLGEAVMLSLSLAGVFCFSPRGFLVGFTGFLATTTILLYYDSLAESARRRRYKWVLLSWNLGGCAVIALIYFRVPPNLCMYSLDLTHGVLEEEHDLRRTMWSFSIREFLVNRSSTLLILLARATYLAFRYPKDCVFIRSRMRVIDL